MDINNNFCSELLDSFNEVVLKNISIYASKSSKEKMEKNADRLLRNADEIAYLPERMNKRFEKKRETLLRNIPDTQVRKEVYKILELDK